MDCRYVSISHIQKIYLYITILFKIYNKIINLCFALVLIDKVLEEDDLNNDGYLEYVEYVLGRQRDHVAQEKRKQATESEHEDLNINDLES